MYVAHKFTAMADVQGEDTKNRPDNDFEPGRGVSRWSKGEKCTANRPNDTTAAPIVAQTTPKYWRYNTPN